MIGGKTPRNKDLLTVNKYCVSFPRSRSYSFEH